MSLLGHLNLRAAGLDLAQLFPQTFEAKYRRAYADEMSLNALACWVAARSAHTFDDVLSGVLHLPADPYEHVGTPGGWALIALLFRVDDGAALSPLLH